MTNLLWAFLLFCSLVSIAYSLESCGNGVFKCTSTTTLKICFNGQLVSSEFHCKNSTICCETSETICSTTPDPSCHDYDYEYKSTELNGIIPNMKVKPGSVKPENVKPGAENTVCKAQGKFPLSNTNCKIYILCIKSPSGFREKQMTCYDKQLFYPTSGLCSDSYVCIERNSTTNSDTINNFSKDSDDFINTISTSTVRTSTVPVSQLPVCDKTGKLLIPNTACTQYLLCVKTSTGFLEKVYTCPSNTLFNQNTAKCTTGFVCPETTTTESSRTTDNTTLCVTASEPNIISTISTSMFPEISITPDSTTPDTTDDATTLEASTNTDSSISSEITTTQYSTSLGITNPEQTTPSSIISTPDITIPDTITQDVTTEISSTQYSTTIYITSIFTPSSTTLGETTPDITNTPDEKASSKPTSTSDPVTWPDSTITDLTTSDITNTPDETTTSKPSPTLDPVTFPESTNSDLTSPNESTASKITSTSDPSTSPDETTPSKITSTSDPSTSPDATISDLTTLSSEPTTLSPPNTASTTPTIPICQAQGKFPIPGSKCKKYLLCLVTTSGFWSMQYDCPIGSLFDPSQKLCTVYYQCSELTTQPPTETTPTTERTTTNSATTAISLCQKQGMFPVSNSNCKKYLLCIATTEGLWGRIYECLPNTTFDPALSQCTKTYECVESTSTTTEIAETTQRPACNHQGRIYISNTGCKQFLLCSLTRSGFKSKVYSCPPSTYFNSKDGRCYSNFMCPESICATTGRFPDPQDKNCEYYYTCIEVSPNHLEGFKHKCNSGYYFDAKTQVCLKDYVCKQELDIHKSNNNVSPRVVNFGQCITIGRWEIQGSKCKNYVLCSANLDGTLKATQLTCPTTSVFNQVIQQCTSKYICPESACFMPGWIPNPNVKDCSSYISCESSVDNMGNVINTGRVIYCPPGYKFNPVAGCDPTYVCPK